MNIQIVILSLLLSSFSLCRSQDDKKESLVKNLLIVKDSIDIVNIEREIIDRQEEFLDPIINLLKSYETPNRRRLAKVAWTIINKYGGLPYIEGHDKIAIAVFLVQAARVIWPVKILMSPNLIYSQGKLCERELEWAISDSEQLIKDYKVKGQKEKMLTEEMVRNKLKETLMKIRIEENQILPKRE